MVQYSPEVLVNRDGAYGRREDREDRQHVAEKNLVKRENTRKQGPRACNETATAVAASTYMIDREQHMSETEEDGEGERDKWERIVCRVCRRKVDR